MKCPECGKNKIKIKKIMIEEKKYLVEACINCNYCDIIYLHKEINFDKTGKI